MKYLCTCLCILSTIGIYGTHAQQISPLFQFMSANSPITRPVEFRNIATRIVLPFLKYVPGLLARHLGSIPKYMVSSFNKNEGSSYSFNSLSVFSKLRSEALDTKLYHNGESLLIQSSFDHHINPYSLYFLKNKILGEDSKIVLRDCGAEHNILNNEDALKIVSTFLLR